MIVKGTNHRLHRKPSGSTGNSTAGAEGTRKPSDPKRNRRKKTKPLDLDDDDTSSSQHEAKQKKNPSHLQVTKGEKKKWALDASTTGTNSALVTHVRILVQGFQKEVIPKAPPSKLVSAFGEKFGTDEIYKGLSRIVPQEELVAIRKDINNLRSEEIAKSTSAHLRNISTVADDKLFNSLVAVKKFGLSQWWPDYTGNSNTPYNNAHRAIALSTFQDAVFHHAYNRFKPIRSQVQNFDLLVRMYDHYVHYYWKKQAILELRKPGEVKKRSDMTNVYKRRKNLGDERYTYLKKQGFPDRICNLFGDPQSVSEDEWDPQQQCYLIKSKPERSQTVTEFAREIDKRCLENHQLTRRPGTTKPRERVAPPVPAEPAIPCIPSNRTPIDYFKPEWFNERDAEIRKEYLGQVPTVALPEEWKSKFFDGADQAAKWKKMSLRDFMTREGNTIWGKYKLPSTEELENMVNEQASEPDMDLTPEQQRQAELLKKLHDREKSKGKGKRRANTDDASSDSEEPESEEPESEEHADPGPSKKKKPAKPRSGEPDTGPPKKKKKPHHQGPSPEMDVDG
ncbi:hypothetical protein MPER_12741 [Moniliophthora perniciosa FA553]|nr:hypothetical protein MPER_12741 [Moniliophthora perniciosa FA553]